MYINQLILRAKEEEIFEIDVSDKVINRINNYSYKKKMSRSLEIFAGISAIAASIIIFFAFNSYSIQNNPMFELYAPIEIESLYY